MFAILSVAVDPLAAKQVTQATGTGSAAIGGNADKSAIVTGNNNDTYQQFGDRKTNIIINIFPGKATDLQQLDSLVVILDKINLEILQQIYQESLPADARLSMLQPADIDRLQMVSNLQDFRQLPTFIDRLIENDRIPAETRRGLELLNLPRSSGSNPVNSSNNRVLESYLSIAIRPSSTPDRFFVNGWLIADSSIKDKSQRFYPLDLDQSDRGIACCLDEIPKVLNNLLELGLQQLKGKQHELTIEIFLPMSCLCANVDRWKIDDLYAETPVGTRYRTIVRSSDRLEGRTSRSHHERCINNFSCLYFQTFSKVKIAVALYTSLPPRFVQMRKSFECCCHQFLYHIIDWFTPINSNNILIGTNGLKCR